MAKKDAESGVNLGGSAQHDNQPVAVDARTTPLAARKMDVVTEAIAKIGRHLPIPGLINHHLSVKTAVFPGKAS
ncbi:MAG: hypothetical protein ACR2Q4_05360 [Geminicoccaceae bacterium]